MAKLMLTLRLNPAQATLAHVRDKLKLDAEEIDSDFGVVSIDPAAQLYTVLVDDAAALRVAGTAGVQGPFANPPIEPFGPPRP